MKSLTMKPLPAKFKNHASMILALGGAGCMALSFLISGGHADHFFKSYLFSFLFWSDLPLGALGFLMIYHLTGGSWGAVTRRILEAMAGTLPLVGLFFIPVILGVGEIYPWVRSVDPVVMHKHLYLNPLSFALRALFYFISWIVLNYFLLTTTDKLKLRNLSAGGLVWLTLTATFASIDWQMSVEPQWSSTIYGLVFVVGEGLTAYSFMLAVLKPAMIWTGFENQLPKKTLRDIGNILLVLVAVWAYLSFMQYLIIWSGNLPHEVTWYNHRTRGHWQWFATAIILFQFSGPFIFLLFRGTKDHLDRLASLGAFLFLFQGTCHYWLLVPAFNEHPSEMAAEAFLNWLGLGGIWLGFFYFKLIRKPFFAREDSDWPLLTEAAHG